MYFLIMEKKPSAQALYQNLIKLAMTEALLVHEMIARKRVASREAFWCITRQSVIKRVENTCK